MFRSLLCKMLGLSNILLPLKVPFAPEGGRRTETRFYFYFPGLGGDLRTYQGKQGSACPGVRVPGAETPSAAMRTGKGGSALDKHVQGSRNFKHELGSDLGAIYT